ncbi:MAG: hypothetical protein NVS2B8_08670 [Vulcanimicrobiaceae bacterium]
MGSDLGFSDAKLRALDAWETSDLFDARERVALAYADRMTRTDGDVDDAFFIALRDEFGEDELVELTALIAWENASSKFNRALRIGSQGLWRGSA